MPEELDLVWGAKGIGEVINRSESQTHHLLESGVIECAWKEGKHWVANRPALKRRFSGPANNVTRG
jgi:hypothetical protein